MSLSAYGMRAIISACASLIGQDVMVTRSCLVVGCCWMAVVEPNCACSLQQARPETSNFNNATVNEVTQTGQSNQPCHFSSHHLLELGKQRSRNFTAVSFAHRLSSS